MSLDDRIRTCKRCDDISIVAPLSGTGNKHADIMVVGQNTCYPKCLESGIPFTGGSGVLLDKALIVSGLTRNDIWLTNVVKCATYGNKMPTDTMKRDCRRYLLSELSLVRPRLVITLGKFAAQDFPLGEYRIVNLYHPAYYLYKHKGMEFIEKFAKVVKEYELKSIYAGKA